MFLVGVRIDCVGAVCSYLGGPKSQEDGVYSSLVDYRVVPLPLGMPLPTPLAPRVVPGAAPPLVLPPLPIPDCALPLAIPPRPGAIECRELAAEGGAEYLLGGLPLVGGFSTNDVSVVRKVASTSVACRSRNGES